MRIGTRVWSTAEPKKGPGLIVGQQIVFQQEYVEVFFAATKEVLTFTAAELVPLRTAEEAFLEHHFSPAKRFMLRFFLALLKAETSGDSLQAAANFKILPLPHQLLAVKYVLDLSAPRALIADEVGLGKTIEAALVYEELKARGLVDRVLIVAPSGLCLQWQEELKQKFKEDFTIYDRETVHILKHLYGQQTNIWTLGNRIITSLDFLKPKKLKEELRQSSLVRRTWHKEHVFDAAIQAGFDLVIIDEAHKLTKDISGEETARYKLGKALAESVPGFILLSATPHQGDSERFRHLMKLVDPYRFFDRRSVTPEKVKTITVRNNKRAVVDFQGIRLFKQRITSLCSIRRDQPEDEIERKLYQAVSEYVSEYYNLAEKQNNRTMMFLLLLYQRMVSSSSQAIWKSLSKRLELLQSLSEQANSEFPTVEEKEFDWEDLQEMVAENQVAYLENNSANTLLPRKELDTEILIVKRLVELAREASLGRQDAKLKMLLNIVAQFRIRENDPELKFIIFTEFVETQLYLKDCLKHLGYKTALLNGRMSAEEKQQAQEAFRQEAMFLISTDAGGEGINLQFCRVLINYDLPWNPMRLEQRIGRIDRIGQKYDVKVVNFQLEDTVEQRVRQVIEDKLDTIRQEFQEGEDKLSDILSTLQEEFSFETIYLDALQKRKQDAAQLAKVAEDIQRRALELVRTEELALPFSQLEEKYSVSAWELEKKGEEARQLLEGYLSFYSSSLKEYKVCKGVYYFDDPLSGKHWKNIIFHQKYALEQESCELIGFGHSLLQTVVKHLEEKLAQDISARIQVKEPKFSGEKGLLFIYYLWLANGVDKEEQRVIPCFITVGGQFYSRLSNYFQSGPIPAQDLVLIPEDLDLENLLKKGQIQGERLAESRYHEFKGTFEERLHKEMESRQAYYVARRSAVQRIAVENIRDAKLKELEVEQADFINKSQRRRHWVPRLTCEQIAYVEFVG